jgi:hypothetical protein
MTAKQKAARAKFKAIVKEASKLRKKNPNLTQAQAVKQAWAISYGKKRAGVGAVKKKAAPKKKAATKVKAKKSKRTSEMHTDTKSHNVNIRVISGMGSPIEDLNYLLREKKKATENFEVAKANRNRKGDTKEVKEHYNYWYNRLRDYIKGLDKRIAIAKKHIK